MQAGNKSYDSAEDLPAIIPVFPLPGALLLPRGQLPLNVFEPRYLAMVDAAMKSDRVVGMIQPSLEATDQGNASNPDLCGVGCVGRLTALQESGDGRYLITLTGVARFEVVEEMEAVTPYRMCRISTDRFHNDLDSGQGEDDVDRQAVLRTFRAYLEANDMDADWEGIERAGNEALVNALSMMSPYGPAEKQALLEADDLRTRAETLIAITEMDLARKAGDGDTLLQ